MFNPVNHTFDVDFNALGASRYDCNELANKIILVVSGPGYPLYCAPESLRARSYPWRERQSYK